MKIRTCYTVPIKQQRFLKKDGKKNVTESWHHIDDRLMKSTSDVCLEALRCCVDIYLKEWGYLKDLPTGQKKGVLSRRRAADMLIHSTKDLPARRVVPEHALIYAPRCGR